MLLRDAMILRHAMIHYDTKGCYDPRDAMIGVVCAWPLYWDEYMNAVRARMCML